MSAASGQTLRHSPGASRNTAGTIGMTSCQSTKRPVCGRTMRSTAEADGCRDAEHAQPVPDRDRDMGGKLGVVRKDRQRRAVHGAAPPPSRIRSVACLRRSDRMRARSKSTARASAGSLARAPRRPRARGCGSRPRSARARSPSAAGHRRRTARRTRNRDRSRRCGEARHAFPPSTRTSSRPRVTMCSSCAELPSRTTRSPAANRRASVWSISLAHSSGVACARNTSPLGRRRMRGARVIEQGREVHRLARPPPQG